MKKPAKAISVVSHSVVEFQHRSLLSLTRGREARSDKNLSRGHAVNDLCIPEQKFFTALSFALDQWRGTRKQAGKSEASGCSVVATKITPGAFIARSNSGNSARSHFHENQFCCQPRESILLPATDCFQQMAGDQSSDSRQAGQASVT